jgi:hypothetical protein
MTVHGSSHDCRVRIPRLFVPGIRMEFPSINQQDQEVKMFVLGEYAVIPCNFELKNNCHD